MDENLDGRDDRLKDFTRSLAGQIREQEKKRFWRLAGLLSVITLITMLLLIRMQQNDDKLRDQLKKQCEARNIILDAQREAYRDLIVRADPEETEVWMRILSKLPSNVDCGQYIRTTRIND